MARGETKDEKDYWKTVENIAREAFEEAKGDLDSDEFQEFIDQSVDGSEFVIYTAQNINVLKWSDTDLESPIEEFGAESVTAKIEEGGVAGLLSFLAFHYMVGDVLDYAQRHAEEWGGAEESDED